MNKIRVGIIGASGYSGMELLKLLISHPNTQVTIITSESNAGKRLSDINPFFANKIDLIFSKINYDEIKSKCDAIFFATPSGTAMMHAHHFYNSSVKIIDISGDFRLSSNQDYINWYKKEHNDPESLSKWTYGLSEVFQDEISKCQYLSNPGCYPTSILLGLLPFMTLHIPDHPIICDSKSGVSGKGKKVSADSLFIECNENLLAYKIALHQHIPEIEKAICSFTQKNVKISFTPHLIPMDRGILSTIYINLSDTSLCEHEIQDCYTNFYKDKPFVKVLKKDNLPQTKHVAHTNDCHIGLALDKRNNILKIISVIDNLVKGAAGSALQNFNLMFNLKETLGLI
ncbi:MAG: N-acetyl-gamma-glutamyl-phosphate reductase [Spirochaetota bacterium]|nr:N-acetyl-gamma-glutamyl-phosphate reductase [Spirochaetota bacterium]